MKYSFAGLELDCARFVLTRDGADIPIEPQVFDILKLLAEHAGDVVSKDQMINEVWGGRIVSDATVSARINAARAAVGDTGKDQAVIRTVPRRGFTMVASVDTPSADATPEALPAREIRQTIRYTAAPDGTSIAWSRAGKGPPVLFAWHHLSHLEQDWASGLVRDGFQDFARHHEMIRYDIRGAGLSDPIRPDDRLDAHVADMLAVADAAGLERFPIVGLLQSAPVAIRLAARHPERVSRLVLHNGYARGRAKREQAPPDPDSDPFIALLRSGGWGDPENGFMRAWTTMVLPMATADEITELIRLIAHSGSPEEALIQRNLIDVLDVTADLAQVQAPTLVIHARLGAVHPVAEGRRLAAGIPGAEFLEVDSSNTFFMPSDPVFERVQEATLEFLAGDG
ncbi:alpha/beta fold hydrolase [Primorskyibacter aestuariivivens]|uniref:alpha/beta fold hydrolase n=1 Tax=Primorskyibacter aestuariivivens TaxID=1888912 RepID=UPI0023011089|nr:alpha/beta fold hydrolase [Primorskyibacter aestuariivivens]MDA7428098.1 alpha/beta fold hydrolase [Primorskyibacter aestuariivivens]